MLRRFVIPSTRAGTEGAYKVPPSASEHGRWRLVVSGAKEGDKTPTNPNERAWAARRATVLRSMNVDAHTGVGAGDATSQSHLEPVGKSDHEGRSHGAGMRRIVFESALSSSGAE